MSKNLRYFKICNRLYDIYNYFPLGASCRIGSLDFYRFHRSGKLEMMIHHYSWDYYPKFCIEERQLSYPHKFVITEYGTSKENIELKVKNGVIDLTEYVIPYLELEDYLEGN